MRTQSTRSAKASEITNGWIVVDAEGAVVGRLASFIARRLRGKHRPDFTPHVDTGDFVVVINAEKVAFTGKKLTDKIYYRHTGHPGGIKERVAGKVLASKLPERVLEKAGERMVPKESGTCHGDSGGPHFLGDTSMLMSVTVTGDPICRATDVTYRLDTPVARAFLGQFLELP